LSTQQAADEAHLLFRDERSDFLSFLALWEFFASQLAEKLSHRRLVEAWRGRFVSVLRLPAWRGAAAPRGHAEVGSEIAEQGFQWDAKLPATIDAARYRSIHDALLAGLLGNVGMKDAEGQEYLGAGGIRFHLHPGSGLAKKAPKWVLAAELVETSRLFARCAARIEPEWIEAVAGPPGKREHFEPQ